MEKDQIRHTLTAIFGAGVTGCSRLIESYIVWTAKNFEKCKRNIFGFIEKHGGLFVNAHDNIILAVYASVPSEVECSIKIQKDLTKKNEPPIKSHKKQFQIGINLGDVIKNVRDNVFVY